MHYSKLFLRTQVFHAACYHGPVFVVKWVLRRSAASAGAVSTLFLRHRPHLDLFPLGVHSATIRTVHLLCPIFFSYYLAPSLGDSRKTREAIFRNLRITFDARGGLMRKSSQVLTPQSCKEQAVRIKKGGGMPRITFRSHPVPPRPPDVAPVGQCAGSTRLYSARSQAWSCACVLREKAHSSS